jgi:hypothetical protein
LLDAARIAFGVFVILFSLDLAMVFGKKEGLEGHRKTPERFSNGDPNPIQLQFRNFYNFSLQLQVIDELPFQFQKT